jgi:hypothetical protein
MAKNAAEPDPKASDSVDSYSSLAKRFLDALRALLATVAQFRSPEKDGYKSLLGRIAPAPFLEAVAVGVEGYEPLKNGAFADPEALRDAVRFEAAFTPVADALGAAERAMRVPCSSFPPLPCSSFPPLLRTSAPPHLRSSAPPLPCTSAPLHLRSSLTTRTRSRGARPVDRSPAR